VKEVVEIWVWYGMPMVKKDWACPACACQARNGPCKVTLTMIGNKGIMLDQSGSQ